MDEENRGVCQADVAIGRALQDELEDARRQSRPPLKPSEFRREMPDGPLHNEPISTGRMEAPAPVSQLFRPTYREDRDAAMRVAAIKAKAEELARLIAGIPTASFDGGPPMDDLAGRLLHNLNKNSGANVTLALRHLEDCVFRAVKAATT